MDGPCRYGAALFAAACVLATATSAQARHALAGTVVDADGKPVAAATVVLAASLSPYDWAGPAEVLRTTTDADGAFRAQVRDCVGYSLWAVAAVPAGGRVASAIVDGTTPGRRWDLRLQSAPARRLHLEQLAPWRERGPLRTELRPRGAIGVAFAAPVEDDVVALPADWPVAGGWLILRDAKGRACAIRQFDAGGETVTLPRARDFDVVVQDPDGKPIAGATIVQAMRFADERPGLPRPTLELEFELGASDAEGRARVRIGTAWDGDKPHASVRLRAKHAGFATAHGGYDHEGFRYADGVPADTIPDALLLRLRPDAPRHGRLHVGDRPVAGCRVRIEVRHVVERNNVGYQEDEAHVVTTDADGRFPVTEIAAGDEVLSLLADAPAIAELAASEPGRSRPPAQPFLFPINLDVDLAQSGRLHLEVFTPDRGPASGATALLQRVTDDIDAAEYPAARDPCFPLDNAGRADVCLQAGRWFVLALDGTRAAWETVAVDDGRAAVHLELAELPRMRGRALDAAGQPVAGARLRWESYSCEGSVRPPQLTLTAIDLLEQWIPQVVTAADGTFELPMFAGDGTDFEVQLRKDALSSPSWHLQLAPEPIEVRLR